MLYTGGGGTVNFFPRICIDLTSVPGRCWGSGPLESLASAAPAVGDLEIWVRGWLLVLAKGFLRALKMVPFDRPYTTFYWSGIVNKALSCIVFELFDVE